MKKDIGEELRNWDTYWIRLAYIRLTESGKIPNIDCPVEDHPHFDLIEKVASEMHEEYDDELWLDEIRDGAIRVLHEVFDSQDAFIQTPLCPVCGQKGEVGITNADIANFLRWDVSEITVQEAFPNMPTEKREQLISGTHPECWDALWKFQS